MSSDNPRRSQSATHTATAAFRVITVRVNGVKPKSGRPVSAFAGRASGRPQLQSTTETASGFALSAGAVAGIVAATPSNAPQSLGLPVSAERHGKATPTGEKHR